MKPTLLTLPVIGILAFLWVDPGHGAEDYFLKIKDIPGSSTNSNHQDELEVLSFNYGAYANINPSDPRISTVDVGNIYLFLSMDSKAYPKLFEKVIKGEQFSKIEDIVLTARRQGGENNDVTMIMKIAGIFSHVDHGGSDGDVSYVSLGIYPTEIEITTKVYTPGGTFEGNVQTTWNRAGD